LGLSKLNTLPATQANGLGGYMFTDRSLAGFLGVVPNGGIGTVEEIYAITGQLAQRMLTMLQLSSGNYRFTAPALALAPTGSGGGGAPPPEGDVDFEMELLTTQLLLLATENLRVAVSARSGLRVLDPATWPVEIGFDDGSGTVDWSSAAWDADGRASLLVGPDGGVELAAGVYYVSIRINNSPETTARRIGTLTVS
jgi:hypothetical protein